MSSAAPLLDAERARLLEDVPVGVRLLARRFDANPPPGDGKPPRNLACTVCSNSTLAGATVLARSFLRCHPDSRFVICLADRRRQDIAYPDDRRIALIEAAKLGIATVDRLSASHDAARFAAALKAFLLERLLDDYDADRVLYFDPNVLVLAPLDALFDALAVTPLLLTPHLTRPFEADPAREIDMLRAGVYNLGFIGVAAHAQTPPFLSWWQARALEASAREIEGNGFVDQKWMDLAPSFFPQHQIVRDPGCNAAYWNLHERAVTFERGRFAVNGQRLRFFQFSGIDVHDLDGISAHEPESTLPAEGGLRNLFSLYRVLLVAHDHLALENTPWAYGANDKGDGVATATGSGVLQPEPTSRLPRRADRATAAPRPAEPRDVKPAWRAALAPGSAPATPYASALDAALRLALRAEGLPVETDARSAAGGAVTFVVGGVKLEPSRKGGAPPVDVAYWMWDETWPDPPANAPTHEIWAPSTYSLEGLARRVRVPVIDLPLAVGLINGARTSRDSLGIADDQPFFVTVLDPVTRRAHDPLDTVRAFDEAFAGHAAAESPPVLVLAGTDREIVDQIERRLAPLTLDPDRVRVRHVPAGADLVGLLCASDCYLALQDRAAFDYWLASAMWHGRPAITTQTGGVADIATVNNSFLVDSERASSHTAGELQPDVAHAASLLRVAVEHREERRNRGARARCDLRATHSVDVVARLMARRLQLLAERHHALPSPVGAGPA